MGSNSVLSLCLGVHHHHETDAHNEQPALSMATFQGEKLCPKLKRYSRDVSDKRVFEDGPPCPTSCSVSFSFLLLDICLFPPEEGHCRGNMPRFFFNSTSWKCEKFIYGGCSGNGNNFETREECLQVWLLKPGDCPRRRLPGLPRPTQAYCIEGGPCPGEEQCCPIGNIRKCVLPVGGTSAPIQISSKQ
uniref:BPTI/Kunitz inhibitor domain-containing protein n=1 Tax=Anolis carolinensis TaxID=28377 RepID=A0A803TET1_ANOCA